MVKISDSISIRKIDNEIFLFDRKASTIHSLNKVGSFIWDQITERTPLDQLPERICDRFDIDKKTAQADTIAFLDELQHKTLISITG